MVSRQMPKIASDVVDDPTSLATPTTTSVPTRSLWSKLA
jgi:hypothetical protein